MVFQIKVGRDGRTIEFDRSVNIKHTFGPFATLLDRYQNIIPLLPSGEPLEPLKQNEMYVVEVQGLQHGEIEESKRQYQLQMKKKREKQSVELDPIEQDEIRRLTLDKIQLKEQKPMKKADKKSAKETKDPIEEAIYECCCWPGSGKKVPRKHRRRKSSSKSSPESIEVEELLKNALN